MTNIRQEILEFLEEDSQSGKKENIDGIERAILFASTLFNKKKSYAWNISFLQDVCENDPELDFSIYNFDIAVTAIKVALEEKD